MATTLSVASRSRSAPLSPGSTTSLSHRGAPWRALPTAPPLAHERPPQLTGDVDAAAPSQRSATHELIFVAETNPEPPPEPPPQPSLYQPHQAPPFTVQLFMWTLPLDVSRCMCMCMLHVHVHVHVQLFMWTLPLDVSRGTAARASSALPELRPAQAVASAPRPPDPTAPD